MAEEKKPKAVKAVAVRTEEKQVDTFITEAISKNLPVETMQKLFELRKEVKAEAAKEAFVAAMAKFQASCPVIKKEKIVNGKDGKVRYKYAPLDQIVAQVKKPLGENDLFYSFDEKKDKDFATAICTITHKFGHFETSSFEIPIGKEEYMNDAQKYGARMTFAKRYAFCNALGILTSDEDTDANTNTEKNAKSPKSKIVFLLKSLECDVSTKDSIAKSVNELAKLPLEEKNYGEIVARLEILVSEKISYDNSEVQ